MKPTHFIKANEPPTIANLAVRGFASGLDRFVGVQPKRDGHPAAVAVFLMTDKAVREVGPFLNQHVAKLPQKPTGPGEYLEATAETTLPQIFAALNKLGHQWVYMDIPLTTGQGLLTIVLGDSVNEAFAAELTKRGAICNLT